MKIKLIKEAEQLLNTLIEISLIATVIATVLTVVIGLEK